MYLEVVVDKECAGRTPDSCYVDAEAANTCKDRSYDSSGQNDKPCINVWVNTTN